MPAKSQAQQRLFGMVHAVQQGKIDAPSPEVTQVAKSIAPGDARDFAATPHKGLPKRKPDDKEKAAAATACIVKAAAASGNPKLRKVARALLVTRLQKAAVTSDSLPATGPEAWRSKMWSTNAEPLTPEEMMDTHAWARGAGKDQAARATATRDARVADAAVAADQEAAKGQQRRQAIGSFLLGSAAVGVPALAAYAYHRARKKKQPQEPVKMAFSAGMVGGGLGALAGAGLGAGAGALSGIMSDDPRKSRRRALLGALMGAGLGGLGGYGAGALAGSAASALGGAATGGAGALARAGKAMAESGPAKIDFRHGQIPSVVPMVPGNAVPGPVAGATPSKIDFGQMAHNLTNPARQSIPDQYYNTTGELVDRMRQQQNMPPVHLAPPNPADKGLRDAIGSMLNKQNSDHSDPTGRPLTPLPRSLQYAMDYTPPRVSVPLSALLSGVAGGVTDGIGGAAIGTGIGGIYHLLKGDKKNLKHRLLMGAGIGGGIGAGLGGISSATLGAMSASGINRMADAAAAERLKHTLYEPRELESRPSGFEYPR